MSLSIIPPFLNKFLCLAGPIKVVSYIPGHNHHAQIMSCNLAMPLVPAVEEVEMNDFGVLLTVICFTYYVMLTKEQQPFKHFVYQNDYYL